jgi:hypothetical protein
MKKSNAARIQITNELGPNFAEVARCRSPSTATILKRTRSLNLSPRTRGEDACAISVMLRDRYRYKSGDQRRKLNRKPVVSSRSFFFDPGMGLLK